MTRTVLVTGVGGFVGSHVVEALLDRTDWHVVGVDSFQRGGEFVRLVEANRDHVGRVTALVHDLVVPFTTRELGRLAGVDYVVNVASRSHVDESVSDPVDFVTNNVKLALTVLELCRAIHPKRLLHVSTDEVYGPHAATTFEHRPSSPYAASKAAQADLVHAYARTYGVPSTIVTSANMFGERQMATAFVPLIVGALVTGEPLEIHHHRGQPGERSYTYVRNVAARVVEELASIDRAETGELFATLPLAGQRRVDNYTLALEVAEVAELPLAAQVVDVGDRRPGYDPTYQTLDGFWLPEVSFNEGLRRTVHWFVNALREESR